MSNFNYLPFWDARQLNPRVFAQWNKEIPPFSTWLTRSTPSGARAEPAFIHAPDLTNCKEVEFALRFDCFKNAQAEFKIGLASSLFLLLEEDQKVQTQLVLDQWGDLLEQGLIPSFPEDYAKQLALLTPLQLQRLVKINLDMISDKLGYEGDKKFTELYWAVWSGDSYVRGRFSPEPGEPRTLRCRSPKTPLLSHFSQGKRHLNLDDRAAVLAWLLDKRSNSFPREVCEVARENWLVTLPPEAQQIYSVGQQLGVF